MATIPGIPIGDVLPPGVLRLALKMPFMAVPKSAMNGVVWLGLQRPRTFKGPYRSQFVGVVVTNDSVNKVILLRIPDMRTVNNPDHPNMQSSMLELYYSDILRAQLFQPVTPMPPDVIVTTVQGQSRIGQASRFKLPFIPGIPVLFPL